MTIFSIQLQTISILCSKMNAKKLQNSLLGLLSSGKWCEKTKMRISKQIVSWWQNGWKLIENNKTDNKKISVNTGGK